jgi:hypothetical protein
MWVAKMEQEEASLAPARIMEVEGRSEAFMLGKI